MGTYEICALIAGAAAAATLVLEIIFMRHRPKSTPARVKKAAALGHVVQARRIRDNNYPSRMRGKESCVEATYVYEVDGKEYRYDFFERVNAPAVITLYYLHDPRYAFWGESRSFGQKCTRLLIRLLPLIVFVAVTLVMLRILNG